jgi:hypothetical protein
MLDSYLDFLYHFRRKLFVSRSELATFLATTKYALSAPRYLSLLALIHPALYPWTNDRLPSCPTSPSHRLARQQATRTRMTQICIPQLQMG